MIARRLSIHGRVQGVGYRESMIDAALACGVAGWVRNRADGTVEALVQGEAAAVERMIDWSRRGPPAARVTRVDAADVQVSPAHTSFTRRPTE
jgi:acylphosphatase